MVDQIFDVTVSSNSYDLMNQFKSYGGDKIINQLLKDTVNKVVDFGVAAAQSKVPIDTGELRSYIGKQQATTSNLLGSVFIQSKMHLGRGKHPMASSLLASWLDEVGGRRSRTSLAVSPFTPIPGGRAGSRNIGDPTAGWVMEAQAEFLSQIRGYI